MREREQKEEHYDEEEDDGFNYSEPIHNKPAKRGNKKEDLAINDNNYPDLN